MGLTAWVHGYGVGCSRMRDLLTESLRASGVIAYPFCEERSERFGVLLCHAVTMDVCGFVSAVSGSGVNRVIAVVCEYGALSEGWGWQLLAAGASDALTWTDAPDCARRVVSRFVRWSKIDALVESPLVTNNLVGNSRCWSAVLRQL